jgi:hypothetical protein
MSRQTGSRTRSIQRSRRKSEAFALKDEDELGEALNAIYVAATDGALRALLSLGCPLEDVEGEMQRLVKALVKEHAEDMPSLQ